MENHVTPPAGFRFNARGGLYKMACSMPSIPANPLDRLNDKPLYNVCSVAASSFATAQNTCSKGFRVFKFTKPRVIQPKPVSPYRDLVSLSSAGRDGVSPHSSGRGYAPQKDKLQKLLNSLKQHVQQQTDPKLRMLCASLIAQYAKSIHHYS